MDELTMPSSCTPVTGTIIASLLVLTTRPPVMRRGISIQDASDVRLRMASQIASGLLQPIARLATRPSGSLEFLTASK
jgi:hypothetical protein